MCVNGDGQDAGPLPRTPPAVASLPRPPRFAKGTVLSEPRITQMAQIFADAPPVCPRFTLTVAFWGRGRRDGVLCFSLGSRLRGKDGRCWGAYLCDDVSAYNPVNVLDSERELGRGFRPGI